MLKKTEYFSREAGMMNPFAAGSFLYILSRALPHSSLKRSHSKPKYPFTKTNSTV
jgi:hypothetical protein